MPGAQPAATDGIFAAFVMTRGLLGLVPNAHAAVPGFVGAAFVTNRCLYIEGMYSWNEQEGHGNLDDTYG